jgi:dolichol-phosphate mannosyltransferase
MLKTLVAMPVQNERQHVTRVLDEVRKYATDILVVDDGSTDDTPLLLAHQPVEVIRHARNRGYGQALIDAFRYAQCQCCSYDWLITMDCDEQHEPASLPVFLELAGRGGADVVSGSRYLDGPAGEPGAGQAPADRRQINRVITQHINERLGLALTDAFCGFKAHRVEALRRLDLNEPGYAFPLQFWVQAAAHGLRIIETPVPLIYNDPNRSFGGSLDNAPLRQRHYLEVFERELARFPDKFPAPTAVR